MKILGINNNGDRRKKEQRKKDANDSEVNAQLKLPIKK